MITICHGNILDDDAEAIVNPVNCVGVMGAGLALEFKKKYPEMFTDYVARCERGEVRPGKVDIHAIPLPLEQQQFSYFILNFPTKNDWRYKSRIEWIHDGLEDLARIVDEIDLLSVALPALGCGYGGLDWPTVRDLTYDVLGDLEEVDIRLYEPKG